MSARNILSVTIAAMLLGASSLAAQAAVKVKENKPGQLKKAKVTAEQAIATAQAKLPNATLDAAEIEEEGGKLIYSFDFKTSGKSGIDEVNIDAMTGKQVGKISHESPADEAKEAKADSVNAAKKKP